MVKIVVVLRGVTVVTVVFNILKKNKEKTRTDSWYGKEKKRF